ncbi:MAG: methylenetetrahydrofolate reductase [Rhodobacteraceae bacterium]|nr:methylenetetrahydrofolate reductase [Paracoccaceae bacterium]
MTLFGGRARTAPAGAEAAAVAAALAGFSIEVMPRTAARVDSFRRLLPAGTRVCIAHIAGTGIAEMVATARRLRGEGFEPMPHLPARAIPDRATLADWLARYRGEAGVREALLIAGGIDRPAGAFASSMDMLDTGLLGDFRRLHVAGHPEGSRDVDPGGGEAGAMAALGWKQAFAARTGAEMAIVTQFVFDPAPVVAWAGRLAAAGIGLPVHIGVAGPAKLQTLLKFAIACGVGPSLRVLERRARDVTRLLMPFEPTEIVAALAARREADPAFPVEAVHIFPLGGIAAAAEWARAHGQTPAEP